MIEKPGRSPKDEAPGVVSRYDDLVATHIAQTFDIHYVVSQYVLIPNRAQCPLGLLYCCANW